MPRPHSTAGRRHRRPGFITLHRDTLTELGSRRPRIPDGALFTLVRLLADADYRTGIVHGSIRELARRFEVRRLETLRVQIVALAEAGELVVCEGESIKIVHYAELLGWADAESESPGGKGDSVGDAVSEQIDAESASLTASRDGLSPAGSHPKKLKNRRQEGAHARDRRAEGEGLGLEVVARLAGELRQQLHKAPADAS